MLSLDPEEAPTRTTPFSYELRLNILTDLVSHLAQVKTMAILGMILIMHSGKDDPDDHARWKGRRIYLREGWVTKYYYWSAHFAKGLLP